jgi:hypothetical protein
MENSVMENTTESNQSPAEAVTQSERMLPQSTVNELIGNAKREAAEKAATRAVEDYKRQQQQPTSQSQSTTSQSGLSAEEVRRLASEEINRIKSDYEKESQEKAHADAAQRIVSSYNDKIAAGKDKYQDFEDVTKTLDMRYYPNVVQLLAEYVDNASDILYNLAQRRTKLNELETTCERNPQDAIYEIKRLSDSIKANEATSQLKNSKAPLTQQRPSNTGTDSGNTLSVRDYKKMYKG